MTKCNQNQPTKILEQDEIHEENESNEEEEIDSSTDRDKLASMKNLMDLDEELLFNQIPSQDMINDNTIRKHCQNMWDEYFKDKSIFGQAQLFVKLFRRKDMRPVLKLLGVDNRKSHAHNINKTIVENLQNAYNKIDNTTRGGDLSNARRALMTTISSRKLTHRKQVRAISDVLHISRRTIQRYIKRRNMLDDSIENNWVNICRVPRKDRISEDVKRQVIEFWSTHSRVSSNRRDTIQIKDQETGAKIEHPKHFTDITQSELFQTFKQEFLNVKIC